LSSLATVSFQELTPLCEFILFRETCNSPDRTASDVMTISELDRIWPGFK